MPILIMAMMTAQSLDDMDADNFRGWKITAVVTAIFAVIGLLPKKVDDKLVLFQLPSRVGYFWIQIGISTAC